MEASRSKLVSDLGEIPLLERILSRTGSPPRGEVWSGDDAAVVAVPGEHVLFTVDTLVEGVDFDTRYSSGADIGFKALAVNLSDIAAMGGQPRHAVTSLTLPQATGVGFVDDIMVGLSEAAERWEVALVGGDLGGGRELSITIALLGAPRGKPILRSGARPGDAVCVTGALGGSAGGLALLRAGRRNGSDLERRLVRRHLRPQPRVPESEVIAALAPTAMIDISDGLAVDLWRLLESSSAGCEVDTGALPVDQALTAARELLDPVAAAVTGGEDYELLFTIGAEVVNEVRRRVMDLGTELTHIGEITGASRTLGGQPLDEWRARSWEHLRGP